MNMEHEEFNSTRVGPYLWDIDVEAMDIEELKALELLCHKTRKQKELEQSYLRQLKNLVEEAAEHNIQFVYSNEDCFLNLTAGREDFEAQEKDYWVK